MIKRSATGQNLIELPPLQLEQVWQLFGHSHLLRVARRYSGEKGLNSQDLARKAISSALGHPKRLDEVVTKLHATERALLQELQRRGGSADGWALYIFARLRGLAYSYPIKEYSFYLYEQYNPATFEGAQLLWGPLADGLLFPGAAPNPWLKHDYFYGARFIYTSPIFTSWVLADQRLLSRLPAEAAPMPQRLPPAAEPLSAPQFKGQGLLIIMKLLELLRGVQAQGGLALTQQGVVNKQRLSRLKKALPALPEPEQWLGLAGQLSLLKVDQQKNLVQVDLDRLALLRQPQQQTVASLLEVLVSQLEMPADAEFKLSMPVGLRACLLHLLRELPHPTTEAAFLDWMAEVLPPELRDVSPYQAVSKKAPADPPWRRWTQRMLRERFSDFGFVEVQEKGGQVVLVPSPALHAQDRTPAPSGPAWVLQPNFELLLYPAQLNSERLQILKAAEALRFDQQTATYRLTRESVYGSLESGLELDTLLAGLEEGSATSLSPSVRRTIQDWAARRERLTLHQGVTLLEFPTRQERDERLSLRGGTPIGETMLLLQEGQHLPQGVALLRYDQPPKKLLKFAADGRFQLLSEPDFLVRQLLSERVTLEEGGWYRFLQQAPGALATTLPAELQARSEGKLPPTLLMQLEVWSGRTPPPALAQVTVLQHPKAVTLAAHPRLKELLGLSLGAGLLTVLAGKEKELHKRLQELGLEPGDTLSAQQKSEQELVFLADTRKKREFLEEAIKLGHNLLVQYQDEKFVGWYGKPQPGKRRQEELRPLSLDRDGSTPYLLARLLKTNEEERIRVQYILGMALIA